MSREYIKWQGGVWLIAISVGLVYWVSCGQDVKPQLQFTEIIEDGWQPPWMPQGLCDTVEGINLHGPTATFVGVTDGYIYSNGQVLDSWIDNSNPYEVLGSILNADWCEETNETMGMLTISGYVDVDVVPDQNYYIIVEVSGHPQPYGLLVGE